MGAPALIRSVTGRDADRPAWCFDTRPGTLIVVCGLAGGAGTSTLAYALAQAGAGDSAAPVLLCESGVGSGGLASLSETSSPLSLAELATAAASGQRPERPFAQLDNGARLVATEPRPPDASHAADVAGVLSDAKLAHGLVVCDCGPDPIAAAAVLATADIIVWTLPATEPALARAQVLFASPSVVQPGLARELLVSGGVLKPAATTVKRLRRLAELRCDRLILIGHDTHLAAGDRGRAVIAYADALQTIAALTEPTE